MPVDYVGGGGIDLLRCIREFGHHMEKIIIVANLTPTSHGCVFACGQHFC